MDWPFGNLLPGDHPVIIADPPWAFSVRSQKGMGRSAERHYQTMPLGAIKALPVADLAAKDCVLLMWVTDPFLRKGFEVIEAWGFKYKTVGFYWTKTNRDGSPFMGGGYWTRANPEQCLLATRGNPKRVSKGVQRWIIAPRREHSRKPDEVYRRVERLCDGPYTELFARQSWPGWRCWGNQTDRFEVQAEMPGISDADLARMLAANAARTEKEDIAA